jgi:CheY-like chemotaxis protein
VLCILASPGLKFLTPFLLIKSIIYQSKGDVIRGLRVFRNWFKSRKRENNFLVFVLSDDPAVSSFIHDTLTEVGCSVRSATTIAEALNSLDETDLPDVLIVDFLNPEIDGTAFIQQARLRFGKSTLPPVLFLMDSQSDEATAQVLEVNDLLPKPFDAPTLLEHISKLAESNRRSDTDG